MPLTIATCQFPVSADVPRNLRYVLRQMKIAKQRGAALAHFSESALGGYAQADFASFRGYDWSLLESATRRVLKRAAELKLWVVLGSNHRLGKRHKPHNSLYLIDARGRLRDRYDKRFLTGRQGQKDHRHYSPGCQSVTFSLGGLICGLLICHEWRYPELYREYHRLGCQVVLQSWYDGGLSRDEFEAGGRQLGRAIEATVCGHAVCNHLWISAANTSGRESCFPSFVVRPDATLTGRLRRNQAGVLTTSIDPRQVPTDPAHWRHRAIDGVLHSGELVRDPRSRQRQQL